ncbi:hypothetical protein [Pseudonocardia kunmingensis]|uniref:Uncharacterized protein n=1 Tax=Pseudonocardia kunmingensis TaxID=630975 RepID=A0A543CX63_9PSEU|nr:hypothetical protein [Pseudonocardia kunmingensis]TQM01704.1 hypothetical protein FB558_8606 [Pseudonocardia kunmingensis]
MGKGARTRRQRPSTAAAIPTSSGLFFHGGVPGKDVGDLLLPATGLGLQYHYLVAGAVYDPGWVYVTTDAGAAHAYASRYLMGNGQPLRGDVYQVHPVGGVQLDPDYRLFPEAFARCPQARVTQVVARSVVLTNAEQAQRERRYQVWGHRDRPVWDEDGLIIPSDQMLANGVTREWTTLLRPWLGLGDVDARGRLLIAGRSADRWATILEVVPSLDRDHQIRCRRWPGRPAYRCVLCSDSTDDPQLAALHQLGDTAVRLIARVHNLPLRRLVQELAAAGRDRDRSRWAWLS